MALVEHVVRQILVNSGGLVSLVSRRFHKTKLPQQATYPAVVIRKVDQSAEPTLDSPATGPPEFDVACFACAKGIVAGLSPEEMSGRIDAEIYDALTGFSGEVILSEVSPPETVWVQGIFFIRSADFYDDRTETYQYGSAFTVRMSL